MLKTTCALDNLSVEQLHSQYGKPETLPITRVDDGPLPPNVPAEAVLPLCLGPTAEKVSLPEAKLILADFGEAFAPAATARLCEDSRSPLAYRPPETRFEPHSPLSFPADIWSLGIAIWNIVGMKPLINDQFVTLDEITAQQVDVLGPLPRRWWEKWDARGQFFDEEGRSVQGENKSPVLSEAFDDWVQKYRKKMDVGVFKEEERQAFLELVRGMLAFEPGRRLTAREVLGSEWVVNWAMKDFEQSLRETD